MSKKNRLLCCCQSGNPTRRRVFLLRQVDDTLPTGRVSAVGLRFRRFDQAGGYPPITPEAIFGQKRLGTLIFFARHQASNSHYQGRISRYQATKTHRHNQPLRAISCTFVVRSYQGRQRSMRNEIQEMLAKPSKTVETADGVKRSKTGLYKKLQFVVRGRRSTFWRSHF